jgi:hypothetical protein
VARAGLDRILRRVDCRQIRAVSEIGIRPRIREASLSTAAGVISSGSRGRLFAVTRNLIDGSKPLDHAHHSNAVFNSSLGVVNTLLTVNG